MDGWKYAYHFRSASVEPLSQQTKFKYAQTVVSQIRSEDWFVTIDLKGIHPYLHPSHSQGVPEVCFLGRSLPISGSSLRPSTLNLHFYKVCGCSVSSAVATRHPYTQLHKKRNDWLILAQSEQMSRCCSRSHKSVGVKTERQEECAFSITENHLSWCGMVWDSTTKCSPCDLLSQAGVYNPRPGDIEVVGVAPDGVQLIASGLSTEVVETILQYRALSMRKLYALKWTLFTSWCGDCQLDPVNCQIGTVLEFLQARLSVGLTHSTLEVYMVAIRPSTPLLVGNQWVQLHVCSRG